MLSTYFLLSLPLSFLVTFTSAQCATPGYVPCFPAGSSSSAGGIAPSDFGDSGIWDSLQGAASDPIQKEKSKRGSPVLTNPVERRALGDRLAARQNALCCAPDPDKYCLLLTDGNIPFCYVSLLMIPTLCFQLSSVQRKKPLGWLAHACCNFAHLCNPYRIQPRPATSSQMNPTATSATAPTTPPTAPLSTSKTALTP